MKVKILVLVDGSKWSQKAALHAVGVAKRKRGRIVLFSVLDRREAKAFAFNMGARSGDVKDIKGFEEEIWKRMKKDVHEVLTNLLNLCREEGVNCSIRIVEGTAKERILEEANNGNYSLVVLGAYGKSGKTRIGSLLEELAGLVRPPMLIVR